MLGYTGLENPRFQFNIYSETLDELRLICNALIDGLLAATTFKAIPHFSPFDDYDDEVKIYRRVLDVSFWHQE